jgi:tripartite-type tricarboxylate transporter receptor subunit TctC
VSGAGGLIAAQQAAKATPDGYTLFLNTVSDVSIAPHIYSKLAYNPNDFELISHLVYADMVLVVPSGLPVNSLSDYVAWAKKQNPLFLATFGPGSPAHFGVTIFANTFGVKAEPVHYKSTGHAVSGLIGGTVPGLFSTSGFAAPHVKEGRLRALAATSPQRLALMPEVPTFTELGFPQAVFSSWFGVAAPAGVPPAVLDLLNSEFRKAVQSPEARQRMDALGLRVSGTSRDEFKRIVDAETAMWGKVARQTGFKAD